MKDLEELYATMPDTFVVETLTQLRDIYQELESSTERFKTTYRISCPSGCGSCCERFVPDITAVEARMVAAYLLFVKQAPQTVAMLADHPDGIDFQLRSSPDATKPASSGCPLYDPDNPYHCTVYPARPLICRLFAASASEGKDGRPVFRRCKLDPEDSMPVLLELGAAQDDVPTMRDYGFRVRAIGGGNDAVQLLPQAVFEAASQLQFIARVLGIGISPDSNPDDTPTPTPIAS